MKKLPPRHESMRGHFGYELYKKMAQDDKIIVVSANFGYGLFDFIKRDYPLRFIDTGAAEQAALGIAVGLAAEGKIPVIYTVTSFLLYRPFEIIRNYIHTHNYPVKLAGSGRDKDYFDHGVSHQSEDAKYFLDGFSNIVQFWPNEKEEIVHIMDEFLYNGKPSFLSLKR